MENLESIRPIYPVNKKLDEKKKKENKALIKKKLTKKRSTKIEKEDLSVTYNFSGKINKPEETGKSVDLES